MEHQSQLHHTKRSRWQLYCQYLWDRWFDLGVAATLWDLCSLQQVWYISTFFPETLVYLYRKADQVGHTAQFILHKRLQRKQIDLKHVQCRCVIPGVINGEVTAVTGTWVQIQHKKIKVSKSWWWPWKWEMVAKHKKRREQIRISACMIYGVHCHSDDVIKMFLDGGRRCPGWQGHWSF